MKKLFLLMLLCLCPIYAQTNPAQVFALYGNAIASSSPKPTGGGFYGFKLSASNNLWEIQGYNITFDQKTKQTLYTFWSGMATPLRTFSFGNLYLLGEIGAAATANAGGASVTAGLELEIYLEKTKTHSMIIGYETIKTTIGDVQNLVNMGYTFHFK